MSREKCRLFGKTAIVTGGAQGLGAAISRRFAEEGAVVFIADMQSDIGNKTALNINSECGGVHDAKAHFVELNVTSEESWAAARAFVEKICGRADILVNNAGINIREPIEEMKAENFDKMLAVNVRGPFLGIKHFIPLLRKSGGGVIINMSSVCGLIGHRYTTEAYTVTKGAVTLLTKTIAVRYAKDNIRCNSIHPSTVETDLVAERLKDPQFRMERLGEVPLGRLATADDVAAAALFLASNEAAFLNGVALPVDGGTIAD